jgi:hypothetical protein
MNIPVDIAMQPSLQVVEMAVRAGSAHYGCGPAAGGCSGMQGACKPRQKLIQYHNPQALCCT